MNIFQKFTLRTLKENKTRTLVTIVGIILSVSMVTAVTTSYSSLFDYLIRLSIHKYGDWHGMVYNLSEKECDAISEEDEITKTCRLQNIGYSRLTGEELGSKPYLYVAGADSQCLEQMEIYLLDGKMPKNSNEIILTEQAANRINKDYQLGDQITLKLGQRQKNDNILWQNDEYVEGLSEEEQEELVNVEEKTYTVVGIFERHYGLEKYMTPGFVALTGEEAINSSYNCYFKMKQPGKVYDFLEQYKKYTSETNESLLRYMGVSKEGYFNTMVYSLAAILISVIMLGSISLIYNAFSISVSERTKAFGLLSSIGATKKQMRKSVGYEAGFLCLIGVPLGILAGVFGMTITLKILGQIVDNYLLYGESNGISLQIHVSWKALLVALLIGIITVYISAWIPTRRALRVNAIDAIRQTQDIKIKPGKVRTSALTSRMFGFEGMMGNKNYKRNRKKYRATVASLFISVVLFISASSLQSYLKRSIDSMFADNREYDVCYSSYLDMEDTQIKQMQEYMLNVEGVEKVNYAKYQFAQFIVEKDKVNLDILEEKNEIYANLEESPFTEDKEGNIVFVGSISFIEDKEYEAYLKRNGFSVEKYMDKQHPVALVADTLSYRSTDEGGSKYHVGNMLKKIDGEIKTKEMLKQIDGLEYSGSEEEQNGKKVYYYGNPEGEGELVAYPEEEVSIHRKLELGERTDKNLFNVNRSRGDGIGLIYPYSARSAVITDENSAYGMYASLMCKAVNHREVMQELDSYVDKEGLRSMGISIDYAADNEAMRALITIVNIFAYGFVILISLIAMANVFNTISTNIGLRRREFAMLKSVGMTTKSFHKMMNYECLLYGVKGLMYGLPVSFLLTWLIYRAINEGVEQGFYIPWSSVLIAIFSVFAVVFATMLYSMGRIKRENPMDVLKDETM